MFTNPLDSIRIASPCRANWGEMYGNERRRFCSECKLNVYNLSDMTRQEAETLLINTEGRLCVRFFRRRDGTVLTRDCPVGWKAVRRRVSKTTLAFCSLLAGFFAGLFSLRATESAISYLPVGDVPAVELKEEQLIDAIPQVGEADFYQEWEGRVDVSTWAVGRAEIIEQLEDVKVEAWVK